MMTHQLTKIFNLRWLTLCLVIAAGMRSAWADETTFTFNSTNGLTALGISAPAKSTGTNLDANSTYTSDEISMTVAHGKNTNTRIWNNNDSYDLRVYKDGGALTFAVSSGTISKIVITGKQLTSFSASTSSASTSSYSDGTWTGSAASVTFTASNTVNVYTVVVTYTAASSKTTTTTTFPADTYSATYPGTFSAPTATVKAGSTTVTFPAVTYSSGNENVATVNSSTGAVTVKGAGTAVITAKYEGNDTYAGSSASYTLTVSDGRTGTTLSFLESSYEAIVGQSFESPKATLSPSSAGSVTYASSNTSIATVNSSKGTVTIKAAGTTVITATFAETSTYKGSTASYTLVVSEASSSETSGFKLYSGDLVEGDYIIYYDGSAMKASISSSRFSYATVTPSNNVIETADAALIWHIAKSGSYWTIYNSSTGKYAASTGENNKGALSDNATDDKALWTVSGSSTYEFVNKYNSSNSKNANLRNNKNSTNNYGFACYSTSIGGALSLYRYTAAETPTTVSAPTLTESCSFWPATTETASKTITITPTTTNSYVRYTTDGSDPTTSSGTLITAKKDITITATTTVKAIAYFTDAVKSSVVSATYTLGQTVNSIAAFKALGNGTEARLYLSPEQNARVLHYKGSEIYLRDNTGAICLYLNSSLQKTIPAHDYHVAGWIVGKYSPYNGLPEMVATTNTTTAYLAFAAPVTEEPTKPRAITSSQYSDNLADWVRIQDLRIINDGTTVTATDDTNTLTIYNKYSLDASSYYQSPYDAALIDATGLAVPHSTANQIVPIYYADARPIIYVVDEGKEFTSPSADVAGATVRLKRTLSSSNWNTFAVPFDIDDFDGTIREYISTDGTTMVYTNASSIKAGKPYLVKPTSTVQDPVYTDITLTATEAQTVSKDGYSFVAIYQPTNIYRDDHTNRFLKADNYIYYPSTETKGTLKGMRAYFTVPSGTSSVKVNPDGFDTAVDEILPTDEFSAGRIFDMSGRAVNSDLRSLPRGIYIVNGKKIVVQ